jgi:hypothetical protein
MPETDCMTLRGRGHWGESRIRAPEKPGSASSITDWCDRAGARGRSRSAVTRLASPGGFNSRIGHWTLTSSAADGFNDFRSRALE